MMQMSVIPEHVAIKWPAAFSRREANSVMAGLVPAIHAFALAAAVKTWMPGTRPGMTELVVQFEQVML
jgi:hypothetical protein